MIYNKPRDFVFKAPAPEKEKKQKKQKPKFSAKWIIQEENTL